MGEAILVNPYDIDDIAAAIGRALEMPRDERLARHKTLAEGVMRCRQAVIWSCRPLARPRSASKKTSVRQRCW
jgi:trehalose 6-phosphate synthase